MKHMHTTPVPPASNHIASLLQASYEALRAELLVYSDLFPRSLIEIGKLALSAPGKLMGEMPPPGGAALPARLPRWPLFVLLSYQAACEPDRRHTWPQALPAAVAVEVAMAAADLLDELADGDPSPVADRYGPAQASNTANLMLVMAQQILLRHALEQGAGTAAQAGVNTETGLLAALATLQDTLVHAAIGQHLDLLYETMDTDQVTLEMSARVTELKAGTLLAGACRMGALLAGAHDRILELITTLGREIGGIAQLINDVQDVLPRTGDQAHPESGHQPGIQPKTDLQLRKRTLPIVFTLRDESPEPNAVQKAFHARPERQDDTAGEEELRLAVVQAGGVKFAELVMNVHRHNIEQALQELEALRPGARNVLSPLLSSVG
jgi:geranylgeranyl pyrophosphate synthase